MWWPRRRPLHLTGEALLARARELGVSTEDERPLVGTSEVLVKTLSTEDELQDRVLEAERHLRERQLFKLTWISVALGAIIGIGGLLATIYFGHQQTQDAKRLLAVQLAREFRDGFDSKEMQRHRAETAAALLNHKDPPTDEVPDFFDGIGFYIKQGLLDQETVWNDFGHTLTHYWPALKAHVADARTDPDGNPDHWTNFERLNDKLLQDHRQSGPGMDDVREFLKGEAELLKSAKPTPPPKVRRGQPRG